MGRDRQIKKAYEFFIVAERDSITFSMNDIAQTTGWSIKTVEAYKTKKWHFFLQEIDDGYLCKGVSNISEDAFLRIHSQRATVEDEFLRPRFTPDVDALIDKSREAALLAIQTYNNPLIKFRAPGYIVSMVIAYTALFHAIFERNGVEYWYKEKDGSPKIVDGDKRLWELKTCVKYYYQGEQTPETENLSLIINLRNKIEHRFIPALDLKISGYCQALLSNYESLLVKEFGGYFALGQNSLALALQLSEYSSQQQEVLKKIQTENYDEISEYIREYRGSLPDDILESGRFCFRAFLMPVIGNHAKSSDVAVEFIKYDPDNPEEMEQYEKQVAFIKQKHVQVADQGKYKPGDVIKRVEKRTGINFSIYHHTCAWKYYKVRASGHDPTQCNVRFCHYSEPFRDYVYTEAWVDFLCEKVQDPEEFKKIKNHRC